MPTARWVHCDVPDTRAGLDWRNSLNAILLRDIRVPHAQQAAPDFHARKDALRKTYAYQSWQGANIMPPHLTPFVWKCGPLTVDVGAALPHLLGQHNFAAMRNVGTDADSTERNVLQAELEAMPPCEFYPARAHAAVYGNGRRFSQTDGAQHGGPAGCLWSGQD